MTATKRFSTVVWRSAKVLTFLAVACTLSGAQSRPFLDSIESGPAAQKFVPETPNRHKFWDEENRILFSTVVALGAADFGTTHSNLQNGGRELNPVARVFTGSTPGQAMNFVGESVGSIGLSYLFHRTRHHRLERITSFVSIGTSSLAVTYGLLHR